MMWDCWLMTERDGCQEFTPYVPNEDGSFEVVVGMCLVTTLEEMKGRARRIVQVDDIWECNNPRLIHDGETVENDR